MPSLAVAIRHAFARAALALALPAAIVSAQASATPDSATLARRTDSVFTDFDRPDSPGCSLGVLRDGRMVYARGYGSAILEHELPITPKTVFDIGSTSKQFTAASIVLLAQDGRLSLDDDIRKFIPELPDLGQRITVRHLLTHTSGIRDYTDVMVLEGLELEQVTTNADALASVVRQRALNFRPGTDWTYSNSGFMLASIIVERVSGRTLGEFSRERIFEPLGMTSTLVLDDHARVIPRRAIGYSPRDEGAFRVDMSNWEQTGDGAVQTSVEDLARWDANFYEPRVGGKPMLDELQRTATLSAGTALDYALGLFVGDFRGLRRVSHGGAWAGYRAEMMRFPERRLSVIVLCNLATSGPTALAERVAAIHLGLPDVDTASTAAAQSSTDVAALAGTYHDDRMGGVRVIAAEGGAPTIMTPGGRPRRLIDEGSGRFRIGGTVARIEFERERHGGQPTFVLGQGTGRQTFRRVAVAPRAPTRQALAAYEGTFASAELGARWTIVRSAAGLVARPPRGAEMPLTPVFADAFTSDAGLVRFTRDAQGRVTSLGITSRGLRDARMTRARE